VRYRDERIRMRVMWYRDLSWVFSALPKEPELNRLIRELCRLLRPRVFWDVGANLGWFTWKVAVHANLSRVLLFEPLPLNIRLLQSTIEVNRLQNMRVVEAAVARCVGETEFMVDDLSGATSQIKDLFDSSHESAIARTYRLGKSIRVKTTSLDETLAEGEPVPNLIKMDVEQAELMAFQGAENLLRRGETVIIFECFASAAVDYIAKYGFDVYRVDQLDNYLAVPKALGPQLSPITATIEHVKG
jgi:FkbM family methyltransferase